MGLPFVPEWVRAFIADFGRMSVATGADHRNGTETSRWCFRRLTGRLGLPAATDFNADESFR